MRSGDKEKEVTMKCLSLRSAEILHNSLDKDLATCLAKKGKFSICYIDRKCLSEVSSSWCGQIVRLSRRLRNGFEEQMNFSVKELQFRQCIYMGWLQRIFIQSASYV